MQRDYGLVTGCLETAGTPLEASLGILEGLVHVGVSSRSGRTLDDDKDWSPVALVMLQSDSGGELANM